MSFPLSLLRAATVLSVAVSALWGDSSTDAIEDPIAAMKDALENALSAAVSSLPANSLVDVSKNSIPTMQAVLETWRGSLAMMPDIIREESYPTPFSKSPLLPMLLLSLARQKNSPNTKTSFKKEYDYIVVGAGTAGCVVASRLSEEECASVLLLEAGDSPPLMTDIPAISRVYTNSDIDWQYRTTRQKNTAYGLINRQVPIYKAKVIGGCSVVNALFYYRGHSKDYDGWAAGGAKDWSWNDVFPFFLKAQNNTDARFLRSGYHSAAGPLTISTLEVDPTFKYVIPQVAAELGYNFMDSCGPGMIGFSRMQGTVRDNQRCSAAKAYLVPAENRQNLHIVKRSLVTKILIEDHRAVGVEFDFSGAHHRVKARKEVIVSAGAINTPKLLMLSGIGPKEILEKHRIQVHSDLPVGKNFHDQPGTFVSFVVDKDSAPKYFMQLWNPSSALQYINNRTGPLAENIGFFSVSYFTNDENKDKLAVPDNAEYFLKGLPEIIQTNLDMKPQVFNQIYGPYLNETMIFCIAQSTHPRSKGYVSIRSADPYDMPIIDPNYYSDPQDLEDVISGMKMCIKIMSTRAMEKFNPVFIKGLMPGCEKLIELEDITKYLRCYARHFIGSTGEDVGTAKMGDPSDPTTVVDSQLRVKGIDGLRVVDASVVPSIPTSIMNNCVTMIAEKASHMIQKAHQCT